MAIAQQQQQQQQAHSHSRMLVADRKDSKEETLLRNVGCETPRMTEMAVGWRMHAGRQHSYVRAPRFASVRSPNEMPLGAVSTRVARVRSGKLSTEEPSRRESPVGETSVYTVDEPERWTPLRA
jgi:hypothetical protein